MVGIWYVSNDCPALSHLHHFRRMERVNFVGPSTVLLNEKVEDGGYCYSYIIVGETEHGVLTSTDNFGGDLNYFKKTGDITIVIAPKSPASQSWGADNKAVKLPVVVVDNYPDAVYARLEVSIDGFMYTNQDIRLDHTFSAEATRKYDGCFFFTFDLPHLDNQRENGFPNPFISHGAEGYALDVLGFTFTNSGNSSYEATVTAVVRLYDENGTLLTEQEQELAPNMRYWEP